MESQKASINETPLGHFVPQVFHIASAHQSSLKDAIFSIGAPASVWAKKHDWVNSNPFNKITFRSYKMPIIQRFDRLHKFIKTKKLTGIRRYQPEFTDQIYFVGVKSGELENEEELMGQILEKPGPIEVESNFESEEKMLEDSYKVKYLNCLKLLEKQKLEIEKMSKQIEDYKKHLTISMEICQNLQNEHDLNTRKVNKLSSQYELLETDFKHQLELYKLSTGESEQLRSQLMDIQQNLNDLQEKDAKLSEDVRKLATENDELKSESKIYQLHKMVVEESEEMKSNLYLHQQRLLEVEKENNKMRKYKDQTEEVGRLRKEVKRLKKYKDQSEEIKSMQMKIQSQNQNFNLKKEQLLTEINELKFGSKMHQLNQMMSAEVTRLKSSLFTEQQAMARLEGENTELRGKLWQYQVAARQ